MGDRMITSLSLILLPFRYRLPEDLAFPSTTAPHPIGVGRGLMTQMDGQRPSSKPRRREALPVSIPLSCASGLPREKNTLLAMAPALSVWMSE